MATRKSVISQLQSVSEDALGKLAQSGPTRSVLQSVVHLKDSAEGLLHGLESIESRLAAIEERLNALEGVKPKRAAARPRSATAKPRAAAAKAKPAP
jgi:hypothetical protein